MIVALLTASGFDGSGRWENAVSGGSGDDTITATITAPAEGTATALNRLDGGNGNDTIKAVASAYGVYYDATAVRDVSGGSGNDALERR